MPYARHPQRAFSLFFVFLLAASFAPRTARADEPPLADASLAACRYTRREVVARAALSGVLSLGAFYVDYFSAPELFGVHGYYRYPAGLLADAPLLEVAPSHGFALEGLQLGSVGGTIALRAAAFHDARWAPYAATAELITLHGALYGTYEIYRDARLQGSSASWTDTWIPATAGGLITAPFHPKNIAHPIVFVPLLTEGLLGGIGTGVKIARSGIAHGGDAIRDIGLGAPLAFDAGVTEEAFFRGVLFEELRLSLGRWPASLIDSTAFAMAHVPGELGVQPQARIIVGGIYRGIFSLLAEQAYLEGGLAESVTLHSLSDTTDFVLAALLNEHPLGTMIAPSSAHVAARRVPTTISMPLVSGSF